MFYTVQLLNLISIKSFDFCKNAFIKIFILLKLLNTIKLNFYYVLNKNNA